MSGSSIPSKVKVGRQWGYPIIVTTGKSKHEAILLDCNTDNPQDFLKQNVEVKIRWKVAMYNESVPAIDVELQNVDIGYSRSRKSSSAVAAVDSKKRKTNASIKNPSAVTSGIKVKEEEIETDNDEDHEIPAAVPSNVNVKEEELETDNDDEKKPAVVTSGANVKEEEEVETDDEDKKPAAVTSSGVAIKTEEVETDDDEKEEERKPEAVTSCSAVKKEEEIETDDDEDESKPQAVMSGDVAVKTDKTEKIETSSAVKTEEVETDAEEDEEEETTLVEFKFCSADSGVADDYELKGTIHIPMIQDATTGLYKLVTGKTIFRGKLDRDEYNEFEGSFVKSRTEGYFKIVRIGFDLGMNVVEDNNGKKMVYPRENIPADYTKSSPLECDKEQQYLYDWEENQGGHLVAYAYCGEGAYHINSDVALYTVLSVHKPNQESPTPLPEGYEPDWDFLVNAYHARLQARNEEDNDLEYAQAAVKEYRHFLALKVEDVGQGDKKKTAYSPSEEIDDVWHTHISFLRRYQCDTLYLTQGKRVIEHLPVLQEDSRQAYFNAYDDHLENMSKKGKSVAFLSVDERFWPNPHVVKMSFGCG